MTVTKGTYCRNMRRSQISINISKAVFPREIIINKIIMIYLIENVIYIFILQYVLLWQTERTLVTCYKNILERRKFHQPRKKRPPWSNTSLLSLPSSIIQILCESNLSWTWEVCFQTTALLFLQSFATSLLLETRQSHCLVSAWLEQMSLNSCVRCIFSSGIGFTIFLFVLAMNWFFHSASILKDPKLSLAAKPGWLLKDSNIPSFYCQNCF